jgi:hypothetical protein
MTMGKDAGADERAMPPVLASLRPEILASLGRPPICGDESAADYQTLYDELRLVVAPTDIIEELLVKDLAGLNWENLRLHRLKAKLLDAGRSAGVETALQPMFLDGEEAGLTADWTKRNRKGVRVRRLLEQAGYDDESLTALSLSAWIEDFERMDQLLMRNRSARLTILREVEQRRDRKAARRIGELRAFVEEAQIAPEPRIDGEVA